MLITIKYIEKKHFNFKIIMIIIKKKSNCFKRSPAVFGGRKGRPGLKTAKEQNRLECKRADEDAYFQKPMIYGDMQIGPTGAGALCFIILPNLQARKLGFEAPVGCIGLLQYYCLHFKPFCGSHLS